MQDVAARLARALEDRYVIEREIGRGGMATVFLATDCGRSRSSPASRIPASSPSSIRAKPTDSCST